MKTNVSLGPRLFTDSFDPVDKTPSFPGLSIPDVSTAHLQQMAPHLFKNAFQQSLNVINKTPIALALLDYISKQNYFHEPVHAILSAIVVMKGESNFDPSIVNRSSGSYGLMQIMPDNVLNISKALQPDSVKRIAMEMKPYFSDQSASSAKQLLTGKWPIQLQKSDPIWQLPYVTKLYTDTLDAITNYFSFNRAGWQPTSKVKSPEWLAFMSNHPDFFRDHDAGLHAMFVYSWANGFPRAFTDMKTPWFEPEGLVLKRIEEYIRLLPYALDLKYLTPAQ
jgi:hypothetical protein